MDSRDAFDAVSAIVSPVFLVGGSVRDELIGKPSWDFDFATPLDPDSVEEAIRSAGKRPYLVGKKFGTVGVRIGEGRIAEITTFRSETYEDTSRKPHVEFLHDLEEDLARRDFTINAMARARDEFIDPHGGQRDLELHTIRAVGDAQARFREDPLRILRAARFASQLGFEVEPATERAMGELAAQLLRVARERWVLELDKLLLGGDAGAGLRLLNVTRALLYTLPDVALQAHFREADSAGARTLLERTIAVAEAAPADVNLRWGALLHQVARAFELASETAAAIETAGGEAGTPDLLGAELADRIAVQLKWSARRRADVRQLVLEHRMPASPLRPAIEKASRPGS